MGARIARRDSVLGALGLTAVVLVVLLIMGTQAPDGSVDQVRVRGMVHHDGEQISVRVTRCRNEVCQALGLVQRGTRWFAVPLADAATPPQVSIQNFAFVHANLVVTTGDTVVWTNMDMVQHSVVSDTGAWPAPAPFGMGSTFSHLFASSGTFAYHCGVHPNMKGSVQVIDTTPPATSTPQPTSMSTDTPQPTATVPAPTSTPQPTDTMTPSPSPTAQPPLTVTPSPSPTAQPPLTVTPPATNTMTAVPSSTPTSPAPTQAPTNTPISTAVIPEPEGTVPVTPPPASQGALPTTTKSSAQTPLPAGPTASATPTSTPPATAPTAAQSTPPTQHVTPTLHANPFSAQVQVVPTTVTGGRTRACSLPSTARILETGCVLIASVAAPGARVTYVLVLPDRAHTHLSFTLVADAVGRSQHVFAISYLPPRGARPHSVATLIAVTVSAVDRDGEALRASHSTLEVLAPQIATAGRKSNTTPPLPAVQVQVVPTTVTGGRTRACSLPSTARILETGCVLIASVAAPGARVTYVLVLPDRAHTHLSFTLVADAVGRSQHVFAISYLPPRGARPHSVATLIAVTVSAVGRGSQVPHASHTTVDVRR